MVKINAEVRDAGRIVEIEVRGFEKLENKTQEECMLAGRRAREYACRRLAEALVAFCEIEMKAGNDGVHFSVKTTIIKERRK